MELRRLDLGGIFERALALYARYFVRFAGIVLAAVVPVAIVQYAVALRAQPQLDATIDALQHPERIRTEHVPTLFDSPVTLALTVAAVLFGYVAMAMATGAIAAGVARVYRNETVAFGACYGAVLGRWYSIVGVVGAAVVVLIVAYVVTLLLVALPLVAAAEFGTSALALVLPLAVGGVLVALTFVLLLLVITSACALCAVVVEDCAAMTSLRLSVERIFNRAQFSRALLCAIAVGALGFVSTALVETVFFSALSHWPAAYVGLEALERTLGLPLAALVLAIYYFDVRIRQEGFDLDTELDGLVREADEPIYAPTAYLSGEERALIKRFLERRDSLTPARRRAIAAHLAAPVRTRVPLDLQRLEDEPLLERL